MRQRESIYHLYFICLELVMVYLLLAGAFINKCHSWGCSFVQQLLCNLFTNIVMFIEAVSVSNQHWRPFIGSQLIYISTSSMLTVTCWLILRRGGTLVCLCQCGEFVNYNITKTCLAKFWEKSRNINRIT